jgi:hypothetical protein
MARKKNIDKVPLAELEKELTPEQRAFLDLVRAGKNDPVFFAEKLLDIRLHDGQKLWLWMTTRTNLDKAFEVGLKLNDENRVLWKKREEFDALVAELPESQKNILVPSNRWGKTLITAVKHLWYLYYKKGTRGSASQKWETRCGTLNLSPHSNQAQAGYDYILDILFSKFVYTYVDEKGELISKRNECKIGDFYISDNTQKRTIFFKNNTFYKAIPTGEDQASSLAGSPYLYISYDECAQSLHLKAELPAKIMSRLIDFGGPLDLVSTPEVDKPSHQYFFHIAKLGIKHEDGWWTLVGKISDNIFLGEKEMKRVTEAIKMTDPMKYRQVAYGEFITTGKKMFDNLVIERLWDKFTQEYPQHEHKYLLVADWGFADTGDPTVFYVIDYTDLSNLEKPKNNRMLRVSYAESIKGGSPFAVLAEARILQREWLGAKFLHDSSSMGGVIIKKMLAEMEMQDINDFSASGDKADMLFMMNVVMSANREIAIDSEGKVIDKNPNFGRLRSYYIAELEEQLGNYQYNPEKGVTDKKIEQDHVMCLGMGLWYLERRIMRNELKSVGFNPLAANAKSIFPEKSAQKIGVHTAVIPERRIM